MRKYLLYILGATYFLSACTKKLDYTYDNRLVQLPNSPSNSRLINLIGATELKINGQALTSFVAPDIEGNYGPGQTKGTRFFPESGRLGLTFTIPQEVLKNGIADSILFSTLGTKLPVPPARPFKVQDDPFKTFDYYFVRFTPNLGGYTDSLFRIPRSISSPVNPAAFKIRLVNLSSPLDSHTPVGLQRNGPFRLAFADGTLVPGITPIAAGEYSEYVEIPYGTYQFKILDRDGKEISGTGGGYNILNPATGTLMDVNGEPGIGGYKNTWLTYAPVKTYLPGGIYSIVVSINYDSKLPTGNPNGETYSTDNNVFRVINDISDPINLTYAKIQGINALPSASVKYKIDGILLPELLEASRAGEYSIQIVGKHTLEVLDANEKKLADTTFYLEPGDNLSAWCYPKTNGVGITITSNNLSGKYYNGTANDDATYNTFKDSYPFWVRFMNFCPDTKEVSFMADNGMPFRSMIQINGKGNEHIVFTKPITSEPYIRMFVNFTTDMLLYASTPAIMPGDWVREVRNLKSREFIAKPELYKTLQVPASEPGVYTVALIGNLNASAPAKDRARMIIVKHTK
ncbi:hypothetical protein DVR12_02370 [Chitinophaga silvatica]|uniref:DUF4397 domain-containing protein n=1 Tax=Chitinophaga silvatica TaxID=2282649 RepID=A0A3E1YGV5_9BACT|nr:hypothetical protein [Chitinophaga silvatica]RFS26655.1 hypothetical protein DVR12_02370 [Chitinophaga silvatica]